MTSTSSKFKQEISIQFKSQLKSSWLIRGLDLMGAVLGLLLLSPFFLVIGGLIKLTSKGPIFYQATRVGQYGRLFKLYKFRSMVAEADQQGPGLTVKDDPRITPLGRFLRRTKLDELPQLFNVLQGEMSLVGPRPEDPRYVAQYTPEQHRVLAAKPGLTSPASLYYNDEETLLSGDNSEAYYREQILPHKLALDLAYLEQRTLWTDLALILKTITAVGKDRSRGFSLKLRNRHFFGLDILALLVIPALALTLRLDSLDWWPRYQPALIFYTAVALLIKLPIFYGWGLYRRYWRYASVNELTPVAIAVGLSTTILTLLFFTAQSGLAQYGLALPRSLPVIDGLLTGLAVGGFRFSLRGLYHWQRRHQEVPAGRRVLVVGAGEAGTMIVREIRANPELNLEAVAFIDDDPLKIGAHIRGLPVLGCCNDIPAIVERYQIQRIVVAIPSAPLGRQQQVVALCRQTGVAIHSLPGMYEILAGYKTISRLPRFDVNQLLGREPIVIDQAELSLVLKGATVLVTGAGGSIGSELCRQIARFEPAAIVLLGHGENSIFEIGLDLRLTFPNLVTHQVIADVRDAQRVTRMVEKYRPDIIFHAAAHKHVPFMEADVMEAVTNNVVGTQIVLRAAEQHGIKRFVLISTDKAVNPTSIMGATKRLAELLVMVSAQRTKRPYIAVRFGNVLGSRGSVMPVFQRQIAAGGPLTVTHPEMTRYFMTIPEAVQLVLQASVLGRCGEIFVLDMGQPVKIVALAKALVKLSGLKLGRDIDIIYTGIRPGEKLHEELFLTGENYRRTKHSKIFVARQESVIADELLEQVIDELIKTAKGLQTAEHNAQIGALLPQICNYIDKYQSQLRSAWVKPTITLKDRSTLPPPDSFQPNQFSTAA